MEIIRLNELSNQRINEPISACIGYFDGLHKGHQALIDETLNQAKSKSIKSALITFNPDPFELIHPGVKHHHIQSFDDRIKIIESFNLDYLIIVHFDEAMLNKSPEDFIGFIKAEVNLKVLVCGFDFHFGYKGSGDYQTLKQLGINQYDLSVIDEVTYLEEKISSTRIRQAISDGDMFMANELLGYNYFIKGRVIHGLNNGHKLGYPTANIKYEDDIIMPKKGVYAAYVKVDDDYHIAMVNYGLNPSFNRENHLSLEAHIIDFDQDLYDKELYIYLIKYLRDEIRFDDMKDLIKQLNHDKEVIKEETTHGKFIL